MSKRKRRRSDDSDDNAIFPLSLDDGQDGRRELDGPSFHIAAHFGRTANGVRTVFKGRRKDTHCYRRQYGEPTIALGR